MASCKGAYPKLAQLLVESGASVITMERTKQTPLDCVLDHLSQSPPKVLGRGAKLIASEESRILSLKWDGIRVPVSSKEACQFVGSGVGSDGHLVFSARGKQVPHWGSALAGETRCENSKKFLSALPTSCCMPSLHPSRPRRC